MPALRDGDAAFEKHRTQLVDQRRTLAHQSGASPMQGLHVELVLALHVNKPHRRPGRRFGDGFGVALVVLLRLDIGLHVLRRHQPDHVPTRLQKPAEMMRAAARLHRDYAGWQARRKLHHVVTVQAPAQNNPAGCVQSCDAAAVLAQVDPQYRYLHRSAPSPLWLPQPKRPGERRGPSHKGDVWYALENSRENSV